MKRFAATVLVGVFLSVLAPVAAPAADVVYGVMLGGRPLDRLHGSALNHDGVTYINVVRAVRAYDGLLTFSNGGSVVRVTVSGRSLLYKIGSRMAQFDNGSAIKLSGAPFSYNGDTYVTVASIALLAGGRFSVDKVGRVVNFCRGSGPSQAQATQLPDVPESNDLLTDLSPLQALSIKPSATADATGLHARAEITNTTAKPYVLNFPGPEQFVLVVARNGTEVWTSQPTGTAKGPSTLRLQPGETTTVSQDWPGFLKAGPGRYTLRVRLRRTLPLDTSPVWLDAIAPGPSASP
jgi:hypothetical protein